MTQARFVIVSGAPGSGKTSLASPLANTLGLPLFAKDTIKEALMDVLDVDSVEMSRRIGAAAIGTMLAVAAENGCGVLESTWRASIVTAPLRRLPPPIVEVFCDTDPTISKRRYVERASSRHRGHFDGDRSADDSLWTGETARPVDGGWPVLHVVPSDHVDIAALAAAVEQASAPATTVSKVTFGAISECRASR